MTSKLRICASSAGLLLLGLLSGCFLYPRDEPAAGPGVTELAKISFSGASGFYSAARTITLTCDDAFAEIYYTTDGSLVSLKAFTITPTDEPAYTNSAALRYSKPINLSSTSLIRARAFHGEVPVSAEFSQIYFINETTTLPVFSLVMNPYHLWDDRTGIYVPGPCDEVNPKIGDYGDANYFQDWERPVHITFFDTDRNRGFAMNGGVKIFGGWSRRFAQKSLALFARSEYGADSIPYDFFGLTNDQNQPILAYTSIVLRNSGDDWYRTMFRDALLQSLLDGMNVDRQAYRPAIVFLNGQYWGIHNIREKINEDYLAAHYSYVDPQAVDILTQYNSEVVEGNAEHFNMVLDFAKENALSLTENYQTLLQWIDVDNLIDYTVAQLFINNTDWPVSNIKYWRPQSADGKWRWIIYDTDSGFGGRKEWAAPELDGPAHNSLDYLFSGSANSDFRTLFVNIINNAQFCAAFLARFRELLADTFLPANVIPRITAMQAGIAAEILRHQARWPDSAIAWEAKVQIMLDYAAPRHAGWEPWLTAFEDMFSGIVKNGTFNGGAFWNAGWIEDGKAAAFTFNDFAGGEAGGTVDAIDPITPQWDDIIMFYQDGIVLTPGNYTLSFDGRASADNRQIAVVLAIDSPGWQVFSETVETLDIVQANIKIPFSITTTQSDVHLFFEAGETPAGTNVYIDNAGITEL